MRLALICTLFALVTAGTQVGAQGPANTLQDAIETIMSRMLSAQKGVYIGCPKARVRKALSVNAALLGDRYLSLARSQYGPGKGWRGTLRVSFTDDRIDLIEIVLLCDPYDREKMRQAVVGIGQTLGFAYESDEDEPWTLFDGAQRARDIWVGLGEGVVVIEMSS